MATVTGLTAEKALSLAVPSGGEVNDVLVKTGVGDNVTGWSNDLTLGTVSAMAVSAYTLAGSVTGPVNVCTSSTRPGSPTKGQTIYETDTGKLLVYYGATTGWLPPWNLGWGYVTDVESSNDNAIGALVTTLLVTPSITLRNDRRYLVTINFLSITYMAAGTCSVVPVFTEGTTVRRTLPTYDQPITGYVDYASSFLYTPAATNTNAHRLRATATAAYPTFRGTVAPGSMSIVDVGPNGNPPSN